MAEPKIDPTQYGFPEGMAQPALRALLAAGYTNLEKVAGATEKELLALHGVGPKSMPTLREALAAKGLAFRSE